MTSVALTVSGPRGEADMELACDSTLGAVLSAIALTYAGVPAPDVAVIVAGRGELAPELTVGAAGLKAGDVLNLFPRAQIPAPVAGRFALFAPTSTPAPPSELSELVALAPQAPAGATAPAERARWQWQGAHGGAGVSTLAEVLGGHDTPSTPEFSLPVVVVARTHAAGLARAQRLAAELDGAERDGGRAVLGLVLVADAPGRLPRALADLAHVVAGGYPRHWALPWSDELRFGPYRPDHLPRPVRRLGDELHQLSHQHTNQQRSAL